MLNDFLAKLEPLLFPPQFVKEDGLMRVIQQIKKGKQPESPSPLFYEVFSDFLDNDENVRKDDVISLFLRYYGYTMASVERMSLIIGRYNALKDVSKQLEGESVSVQFKKNSIYLVAVFEGWILKIRYFALVKEIKEFLHIELENDTNTLKVDNKLVLSNGMLNEMVSNPDLATISVKFKESLVRKAGTVERKWKLYPGTDFSNCLDMLVAFINNDQKLRIYRPDVVVGCSEVRFKTSRVVRAVIDQDTKEIPSVQVQTENYFKKKAIVSHFTLTLVLDEITPDAWDNVKQHLVGLMPVPRSNPGG
nr:hypothetical protein [Candidatus Sigynarchaeota archaeon]